jgi:hypothetical protein
MIVPLMFHQDIVIYTLNVSSLMLEERTFPFSLVSRRRGVFL